MKIIKLVIKTIITIPLVVIGIVCAMLAEILNTCSEACWKSVRYIHLKKEDSNEAK